MSENKIAIIGGTGDLGFALALRWARAGVHVYIGSRDSAKAEESAQRLREIVRTYATDGMANVSVSGLENSQAAAKASIVVLAVPISAQAGTLKVIRGSLQEAILVDATVPLAAAIGDKPTRMLGIWQGSAAAQARDLVPATTPVLAAFHNVSAEVLRDLSVTPECDILVCGDNESAKQTFFPLVKLIPGLRPIDAGPLETSRIVESITALLISLNQRYRTRHTGIRITGLEHVY